MSGTSSVRQLILLLILLGYGNNERSEATSASGSSEASQTSAYSDTSSSSTQQNNRPYLPLSSGEISPSRIHRSGSGSSDFQLGDQILKIRRERERPFRPSVILPVTTMLRKLNVKMLDPGLFSIVRPENPLHDRVILHYPITQMPSDIRKFVRRFMRVTFGEGRSQHKRMARSLKSYLKKYTVCPVKYKWHDFGQRYWPRWVRLGACYNRRPSCSIPEGMRCRPGQIRTVTVLRYLCPFAWQRANCDWRAIKFRVLLSCTCGC